MLLATSSSTKLPIHLSAVVKSAEIRFDWTDLDALSAAVPLIASIYPNGSGDVNDFRAAGRTPVVRGTRIEAGLQPADVPTIWNRDLSACVTEPVLADEALASTPVRGTRDPTMARHPSRPDDGMRLVRGDLGRATVRTSAVAADRWTVDAPVRNSASQDEALDAFRRGDPERDVIVIVRFQGLRANGMPDLHKLTPSLGSLQGRGFRITLIIDGRTSSASDKVPTMRFL